MPKIITPATATFDLGEIEPSTRYELWRQSISVIFESGLKPDSVPEAFSATLTTCHLSTFLLSTTHSVGQLFNRPHRLIAQDGLDHCLLQLYLRGSTAGQWGNKNHSTVRAGDIFLLDLNQPVASQTTDFSNITLVIPRAILAQHLPNLARYHGCRLPRGSVFARLLGEHLISLQQIAPTLNMSEANTVAEGVACLAGTYFSQQRLVADCPPVFTAMQETVRHYIANNLTDPELGPNSIAAHFNMSRAYLYRLFGSGQGVTHYIKEKRLLRAYREFSSINRQRRISEVAFSLGFGSESHFSRSFQQLFGMSPSDVRANTLAQQYNRDEPPPLLDRRYEEWVRRL